MFSPHGNVWNFDLGKLVVPGVFMDSNLLIAISKNYDPITRIVRRLDGEPLIRINAEEIQEVFSLEPVTNYHEPIDFQGLEKE